MGFEVEVKYRFVHHDRLIASLFERGAIAEQAITQADIYLNHPARDFAVTNEAFRIRRVGEENRITYKGPRRGGPTKTREEIEIELTSGEETFTELLRLFECLGFRPVATIRKSRTPFHLTRDGRRSKWCSTEPKVWATSPRSRPSRAPKRTCPPPRPPYWRWRMNWALPKSSRDPIYGCSWRPTEKREGILLRIDRPHFSCRGIFIYVDPQSIPPSRIPKVALAWCDRAGDSCFCVVDGVRNSCLSAHASSSTAL